MYLSVLSSKQIKLLKEFKFLKNYGFYLAGGTALALQINHRTSLDFDFYTEKRFDSRKLREEFDRRFKKVQEIYIAEDTLGLSVNGVGISFFRYPYKLIRPLKEIKKIWLASLEDITTMKIISISQRGRRRDFIDIYFLIKHFGLKNLLRLQKEKYPERFNKQEYLKALLYFGDAEKKGQGRSRIYLYSSIDWAEIKRGIEKAVRDYQMGLLKE